MWVGECVTAVLHSLVGGVDMTLREEIATNENRDELDSRVELTEAGMVMLQLARIDAELRRPGRYVLTFDETADGFTLEVVTTKERIGEQRFAHFTVHGESVVDVLSQAAQVLAVE
jgi:hypothetical protein